MQPAIIFDLQKEFLTEAISAPMLFRDLGNLKKIVFPLPPFQIQKNIVDTISQMTNAAIDLRKQFNILKLSAFYRFEMDIFK